MIIFSFLFPPVSYDLCVLLLFLLLVTRTVLGANFGKGRPQDITFARQPLRIATGQGKSIVERKV